MRVEFWKSGENSGNPGERLKIWVKFWEWMKQNEREWEWERMRMQCFKICQESLSSMGELADTEGSWLKTLIRRANENENGREWEWEKMRENENEK